MARQPPSSRTPPGRQRDRPLVPVRTSSPQRLLSLYMVAVFGFAVAAYLTAGYLHVTEIACTDTGCDLVRLRPGAVLPLPALQRYRAAAITRSRPLAPTAPTEPTPELFEATT